MEGVVVLHQSKIELYQKVFFLTNQRKCIDGKTLKDEHLFPSGIV